MNKTNIFKALANFQQEVPVIHKSTQGYGYTYSDLPKIFEVINPLLKKNGLGFTQLMEGQNIKTVLFHVESGETLESTTEMPQNVSLKGMNDFQVLGSAITYLRRYSLSSLLGLVTDKDTDAGGEQKQKIQPMLEQKKEIPVLTDEILKTALTSISKINYTLKSIEAKTLLATEDKVLILKNKLQDLSEELSGQFTDIKNKA